MITDLPVPLWNHSEVMKKTENRKRTPVSSIWESDESTQLKLE